MNFRKKVFGLSEFERRVRALLEENTDMECKDASWDQMVQVLLEYVIIISSEHLPDGSVIHFLRDKLFAGIDINEKMREIASAKAQSP